LITARDVVMGHPAPFDRSRSVPITAERFALALAVDMVLSGGTDADLIHVEAARAYASTLGRLRRRWRKRHRLYATAWVTPDDQFEAYRRLGDFRASTPHRACVRVGRQTYGH
jgi:hypothetical protein